jgi:hypothetical protein
MMDESKEMDERCLALLHAARIGDKPAVLHIADNISHLYAYANKPSRRGMDNLMAVLKRSYDIAHDELDTGEVPLMTIAAAEEAADYDPAEGKVTNQEKAEAAYHRWRSEKRP